MNESFLKVAKILKQNGVKDTSFLTATYDENVVGLDPYDPNLSRSDKTRIINECKNNIWYFLREVARVPSYSGKSKFELNIGTCALIYLFQNNVNAWVRLPRQSYQTGTMIQCTIYDEFFNGEQTDIIHPKSGANKQAIQEKKKESIRLLPSYIKARNETFKTGPIMIDDAELLKYDEFKWIKKTSKRFYFSSVIIDKCDPKLAKEIDNLPKFTFDMYNSKIRNKLVLVTYPPKLIYSTDKMNDMKHLLFDEKTFQREIMLERV